MGDATAMGGFRNQATAGRDPIPDQFRQNRTTYGFGAELRAGRYCRSESRAAKAPGGYENMKGPGA
jgi:hypothetical protein